MDHRSTKERRSLVAEMLRSAGAVTITDLQTRFAVRTESAGEARLAEAAFALLTPGETVFLDASSTTFFVARLIAERGLGVRVITNSLPVLHKLADAQAEGVALGGTFRRLTCSYVGPATVRAVREHFADQLLMSVTGVTEHGVMTDVDVLEAEVKRTMLEHAARSVLLIDRSKLAARGRQAIARVDALSLVVADGLLSEEASQLKEAGADVRLIETEV